MTCLDCRQAELLENRENIRYAESGLPNVTLCDILVERCPACGNTLVKGGFRLEHARAPQPVKPLEIRTQAFPMGEANELLLRSLVAHNRRIENYFEEMANLSFSPQPHAQRRVAISYNQKGWVADVAA